jgi:hypothetical protein
MTASSPSSQILTSLTHLDPIFASIWVASGLTQFAGRTASSQTSVLYRATPAARRLQSMNVSGASDSHRPAVWTLPPREGL